MADTALIVDVDVPGYSGSRCIPADHVGETVDEYLPRWEQAVEDKDWMDVIVSLLDSETSFAASWARTTYVIEIDRDGVHPGEDIEQYLAEKETLKND